MRRHAAVAVCECTAALVAAPAPAVAHGAEDEALEKTPARALVQQALALLAPGNEAVESHERVEAPSAKQGMEQEQSAAHGVGASEPTGQHDDAFEHTPAAKDDLLKRLRRVEGQVRGVQGMIDEDRHCIDVLTQIAAIQAALDKVALGLLNEHAHQCIVNAEGHDPTEQSNELVAAVGRLMGRA